ncbi:hypothetical protein COS55_00950 [Candidatus Shapirobacteria bacterium CG03_land_8_20_14_0_80_40_19]|uniref:Soluble ligand binding domain-containing protein n=3 Tax=Candidatus Shapironibacteriota TaxID=1752721 RepID=A0A2M7BFI4_9BACT|nr:MAG: hypothetical protein COS55_00950 [Candidatus Shapirobacteria bacterium CG03_land_8_20_14_0_80_40_19]PJC28625.1 MAG: hypothetical protein CO053_03630 [Candidatus Shapirobacteria bacterium CG_4_9_14_0_2_um_filter_40_11]
MDREIIDVGLGDKEGKVERKFLLEEFLENNKFTIGILLLGIILVGAGVLGFKVINFSGNQPEVQILGEENTDNSGKEELVVEISGEIQKPGVYNLTSGSRINDLLIAAGGLSVNADRDWVVKNVNLAQKLTDGAKIFIPAVGENSQTDNQAVEGKININTASEAELDMLWGIGPATAQKVISGRPYQKTEDLLNKKIVKTNVWEEIKDKISVY